MMMTTTSSSKLNPRSVPRKYSLKPTILLPEACRAADWRHSPTRLHSIKTVGYKPWPVEFDRFDN